MVLLCPRRHTLASKPRPVVLLLAADNTGGSLSCTGPCRGLPDTPHHVLAFCDAVYTTERGDILSCVGMASSSVPYDISAGDSNCCYICWFVTSWKYSEMFQSRGAAPARRDQRLQPIKKMRPRNLSHGSITNVRQTYRGDVIWSFVCCESVGSTKRKMLTQFITRHAGECFVKIEHRCWRTINPCLRHS